MTGCLGHGQTQSSLALPELLCPGDSSSRASASWLSRGPAPTPSHLPSGKTPPQAAAPTSEAHVNTTCVWVTPGRPARISSCPPHIFTRRPQAAERAGNEPGTIPGFRAQRGPPVPPEPQNMVVGHLVSPSPTPAVPLPQGQWFRDPTCSLHPLPWPCPTFSLVEAARASGRPFPLLPGQQNHCPHCRGGL